MLRDAPGISGHLVLVFLHFREIPASNCNMKNIYSDMCSMNVEVVKLEIENYENITFSNLKH
jgi:hypothetical protein